MNLARQLGRQPALAHPGRPAERDECARAGLDLLPALTQPAELAGAAGQWRGRGGIELAGQLDDGRRQRERVVLAQDCVLQFPQLRSGFHADVLDEPPARVLECLEGLGLPATAVEREHELAGEPLAGGVVHHQLAQLADEIGLPARVEVRGNARLQSGEPPLLQPRNVGLRERLEGQVGERCTSPEAEALTEDARGALGVAGRERPAAFRDALLEAFGVELSREAHGADTRRSSWPGSPGRRGPCAPARR